MVKKKILVLIILFTVIVACKGAEGLGTFASATPTLMKMHYISKLTLSGDELYFGAGHCLHRLNVRDQTLIEVMCNQEWVFQKPVIDKQRAYVQIYTTPTEEPPFLAAIDLNTQTILWRLTETRMTEGYWWTLRDATVLYMDQIITIQPERLGNKMQICGFDTESGQQIWCADSNYYHGTTFLLQDNLIWHVITKEKNAPQNGLLVALSPQTGKVNQSVDMRSEAVFDELLYMDEQWIFGYEASGTVFAINRDQPKTILWSKKSPEFIIPSPQFLVHENLFIYSTPKMISAVDVTTGQLTWQFNSKTMPAFTNFSTQVVLFTLETREDHDSPFALYALDAVSGTVIWTYPLADYANPIVSSEIAYIANRDSIDALDMKTGALLWQVSIDSLYEDYVDFSGM